jgi:TatD DNase family protein
MSKKTLNHFDIHTHLNTAAFNADREEVIQRTLEAGVFCINVGTQKDTSKSAVEIARKHDGMYASVGLHPIHTSASFHDKQELGDFGKVFTSRGEVFDMDVYRELASDPKVVAIGECGLDYFRQPEEEAKKKQIEAFEMQIALANEVGKPLMLHLRSGPGGNAYKDAVAILKKQAKVLGNSHFFAGSLEDAQVFWDMGYSTSLTGVITFTHDYDEVIQAAPLDLIHAETDAPYVAPAPYRGKRNEPVYVIEVVKKMAQLRGVEESVWADQLVQNAERMFRVLL